MNKKILIVGTINNFCLETSYAKAATGLGYEVQQFDPRSATGKHIKFGKIGQKLHEFLPVETWVRKMNRELVVMAKEHEPGTILLFGNAKILYGTLITIKLILPDCKIGWIWPDTPMNLESHVQQSAPFFDISATYSKSTLEYYQALGFNNPRWIALAADNFMHYNPVPLQDDFDCDISFVGMWRPERERVLKTIKDYFTDLKIEIHGYYWKRNCSDKDLLTYWKGTGFFADGLGKFFSRSRININVIDDTNFPAANMRFFEIPVAGGLQVVSACPEMETEFKDGEHILYFKKEADVVEKIRWVLDNAAKAHQIRLAAQQLTLEKHTYTKRLTDILQFLKS